MWDTTKQQQLDDLQRRREEGTIGEAEDDETLTYLLAELEQEEWVTLRPALGRLREERKQLQTAYGQLSSENAIAATFVERLEDLLQRARTELAGLLSEHEALKNAYERIVG
jgi:MarR-like DNA-binding transcriptional regulator SgrR of sgrS sRNA